MSAERLAQQHRSLSRCPAGVPPLAREQRLHKGEGVKGLQVVDALAHPWADRPDGLDTLPPGDNERVTRTFCGT